MSKKYFLTIVASCFLLSGISAGSCSKKNQTATTTISIPEGEKDASVWGAKYPNHHDSYLKNSEKTKEYGKYRNDDECRLSPWPFQLVLFDGWGMGIEYNEPNGHTEMLKDQIKIDASRKKPGGGCLTCKSPYAPELRNKLNSDYFKKSYAEVWKEIPEKYRETGIVCIDCHNPKNMDLRISRWTLIEALKTIGKDPEKITRQELRSLVCAQCHVTYSIPKDKEGKSEGILFPWKYAKWGNITIEAVIKQIKEENLREWKHNVTNYRMGHIRHPDFEIFASPGSIHWAAGVACADCHMPYERVGREKISSHRWESPFKKNMAACMQCHNQSAEWLKQQVLNIQDRVNHLFTRAGYAVASAALTIEAAEKNKLSDSSLLKKAKEIYEKSYYRNTWVGAENSMGFHNPPEVLRVLGDAIDQARRAEMLAREVLFKAGIVPPEFDIEKIDQIVADRYKSKDGKTGFKPWIRKKAALLILK